MEWWHRNEEEAEVKSRVVLHVGSERRTAAGGMAELGSVSAARESDDENEKTEREEEMRWHRSKGYL